MTDNRVTFEYLPTSQPGWHRRAVHVEGELIGYLDRHATPDRVEWLIADPKWNSVADRTYADEDEAIAALVANGEAS